jgi:hypothetical protein
MESRCTPSNMNGMPLSSSQAFVFDISISTIAVCPSMSRPQIQISDNGRILTSSLFTCYLCWGALSRRHEIPNVCIPGKQFLNSHNFQENSRRHFLVLLLADVDMWILYQEVCWWLPVRVLHASNSDEHLCWQTCFHPTYKLTGNQMSNWLPPDTSCGLQ